MSRQNRLLMDAQIKNSVTENNLIESVIEYSLLETINDPEGNLKNELPLVAGKASAGMLDTLSSLFVYYNSEAIFVSDKNAEQPSKELVETNANTRKHYQIAKEGDAFYIYVSSDIFINNADIDLITKRDISETRNLIDHNIQSFRVFVLIILLVSGIIVYIITTLLTRPLEKLNSLTDKFAEGNFSIRSNNKSRDEVGLLSDKFNNMADSVENHIDELNDMLHRRDQFVADFTHEIKTPMTTIIGYADTIRSVELEREEEVKAASYIFSEGKRLEQMSAHLFDLIYLKDGKVPKQHINTIGLGQAVVTTLLPAIENDGLRLEYDFENACISGDSSLLKTAFINLLDNARKAAKQKKAELEGLIAREQDENKETSGQNTGSDIENDSQNTGSDIENDGKNTGLDIENIRDRLKMAGVITFRGRVLEDKEDDLSKVYEFVVEDHGIGIAKEDIDRICDEFYMVDKSRSRKEGGAGLGMSLVSAIIKEHEGQLKIESQLGQGTRMIIRFGWCQDPENEDME
ncbi:MAG: HAMP domain-containing histidine kinase [Eubacterium sp.]|nr:HAMP domain-containing histidine kinase [Eubacterium sp.]